MNKRETNTYIAIFSTCVLAIMFMIFPLPNKLSWLRPHWLTMVLIYWIIFVPNSIGVVSAFIAGLLLDLLCGMLLGSTGLVLASVAFLSSLLKNVVKQSRFWQQLIFIVLLIGFEQLISLWLQSALGRTVIMSGYWMATVLSIIAWPILFPLLQSYRKKFKIL